MYVVSKKTGDGLPISCGEGILCINTNSHGKFYNFFYRFNKYSISFFIRPGVAPLLLINWCFSSQSSKHCNSQTYRARELKFWENIHLTPFVMCDVPHATYHLSHITCHLSHVICHLSTLTIRFSFLLFCLGGQS